MTPPKPWVNVAAFCEKVLIERDSVVSAIRIVDVVMVPDDAPRGAAIPLSVLVVLRAGDFIGDAQVSLMLEEPDGTRKPFPEKWPVMFPGNEQGGVNLVVNFALAVQTLGLYWVEIIWNDEILTRIPLKLVRALAQNAVPQQSLP
jgi:hypothetical protein